MCHTGVAYHRNSGRLISRLTCRNSCCACVNCFFNDLRICRRVVLQTLGRSPDCICFPRAGRRYGCIPPIRTTSLTAPRHPPRRKYACRVIITWANLIDRLLDFGQLSANLFRV